MDQAVYSADSRLSNGRTGKGLRGNRVAVLTIDQISGAVTDAQMEKKGSPVLDNAALKAFRRWRFKPNTSPGYAFRVNYTLTGTFEDENLKAAFIRMAADEPYFAPAPYYPLDTLRYNISQRALRSNGATG